MTAELRLVDRLRGIYTLPVNDGQGELDGKNTYTREFWVPPIHKEAAQHIEDLEATLATYRTDHDANVVEMEEANRRASAAELAAQHTMAAVFVTSGVGPPGGELSLDRLGGMAIEAVRQQRLRLEEAEALIRMTQTVHGCWCESSWKPKHLGHTDRCQRITAFQDRKPR